MIDVEGILGPMDALVNTVGVKITIRLRNLTQDNWDAIIARMPYLVCYISVKIYAQITSNIIGIETSKLTYPH